MPFFEPPEDTLDSYQLELLASVFRQTWSEIVPTGYRLPQSKELRLQKEVSERLCALLATAGVMDPMTLQALTVASIRPFPRKSRQRVRGEVALRSAGFSAVYFKSSSRQQLVLKRRSGTHDYQLLTRAWQATNAKARKLGWIA
jgi:hypothetical protein